MQTATDPYGWETDNYDDVPESDCPVHNGPCQCDDEPDDWWDTDPLTGAYGKDQDDGTDRFYWE